MNTNKVTLQLIENDFESLPKDYKTKDIDFLIKKYHRNHTDVSILKPYVNSNQKYHRIYFGVSLLNLCSIEEQLNFIEDNFDLLHDWWHVDQLTVFIKQINSKLAYDKAKKYIYDEREYVRRWGYVLFIKNLWNDESILSYIYSFFKDDNSYHVIMAEAWLLSYLAISFKNETYDFLKKSKLSYSLISKTIQKICDSYRVSSEDKNSWRNLRKQLKEKL